VRQRHGWLVALGLVVLLAGCGSGDSDNPTTTRTTASPSPSDQSETLPTAEFADISEDPVSAELAARFQAALSEMAGGGGMAATVMSAEGTWSGATGKADEIRGVRVDDQFAIASVTKSVVAAPSPEARLRHQRCDDPPSARPAQRHS